MDNSEILKIGLQYQMARNKVEESPILNEFKQAKEELIEVYNQLISSYPHFSRRGKSFTLNDEIMQQCLKLKESPLVSTFLAKAEQLKIVSAKIVNHQDYQNFRVNQAKFKRAAQSLRQV